MLYRSILLTLPAVFAFVWTAQAAGYLGVAVGEPSGDEAKGAAIVAVIADSPAEKIGLAKGDIVLAVNKVKVASPIEMVKAIQSMKEGDEVKLKVRRDGKTKKVTVTLGERPDPPSDSIDEVVRPFIGIGFRAAISPDQPETPNNLTIARVAPDSPAQKADIKPGDILVQFEGKKVKTFKQLVSLVQEKKVGDEVVLKIERDGKTLEKKLTLKGLRPQRR